MTPEVDRTYNTRSGRTATITGLSSKFAAHPFAGVVGGERQFCTWNSYGKVWNHKNSPDDLIDEVQPASRTTFERDTITGLVLPVRGQPSWNFENLVRLQKAVHAAGAEVDAAQKTFETACSENASVDDIIAAQVAFDIANKRFQKAKQDYEMELEKA